MWIVRGVPQIETEAPDGSTAWRNVMAGYPHGHRLTGQRRTLWGVWDKNNSTIHAKFQERAEAEKRADEWNRRARGEAA